MLDMIDLILYLTIITFVVLMVRQPKWFRRSVLKTEDLLEWKKGSTFSGLVDVANGNGFEMVRDSIAAMGNAKPKHTLRAQIFRMTMASRILTSGSVPFFLFLGFWEGFLSFSDPITLFFVLGLGAYGVAYSWMFRAEFRGATKLRAMNMWFQMRTYDLSELTLVEVDPTGRYLLFFADGKSASVCRFIDGHDLMVSRLLEHLDKPRSRPASSQLFPLSL